MPPSGGAAVRVSLECGREWGAARGRDGSMEVLVFVNDERRARAACAPVPGLAPVWAGSEPSRDAGFMV